MQPISNFLVIDYTVLVLLLLLFGVGFNFLFF